MKPITDMLKTPDRAGMRARGIVVIEHPMRREFIAMLMQADGQHVFTEGPLDQKPRAKESGPG